MVERFDLNEGGFLGERGHMEPSADGDYVHVVDYADLERQIAELRAERDKANAWAKEQHAAADRYAARVAAAEEENARLKALPPKDEVERVLGMIASSVDAGITENDKHHRIRLKDGSHIKDGYLAGPTADDLRNSFVAIRNAASILLSRLRAGEQEGWRSIENAPKTGEQIIARKDRYAAFSCWWDGEHWVHFDHEDGYIIYEPDEWQPFPFSEHVLPLAAAPSEHGGEGD